MVNFWGKKIAEADQVPAKEEATTVEQKKKKDETFRSVDIYGLKSFTDAKSKAAKGFWLTLLILCTGIFVQQLYKTISNYVNSPVVSTYTIKTVNGMEFPIVYICPTSFVSNLYLNHTPTAEQDALALKEEMGNIWDSMDYLATGNLTGSLTDNSDTPTSHVDPPSLRSMRRKGGRKSNQTGTSDRDPEEFFKNATVPLLENVRYCEFRSFNFEELSCQNITYQVLDPDHGKCYVVDVGSRLQTVQSQALILLFNVRSNWFPKAPALTPLLNGVHVSVQRKYNVDKSGESVVLTPGTYNRVDLSAQRQVFKSFQHPYPQACLNNKSYPAFQIYNVPYTQQSCLYDCAAIAVKKACNCVPPVDKSLYAKGVFDSTHGFCKSPDAECIQEITGDSKAVKELQSCRDKCQRPCEDWRYSVRATSMELYKYGFEPGIPVHDLIYILVSFSQMEFTEFKQDDSKTPDQMIADIGGEASLWLGAGMLSIIQMPIFFVSLCGGCCKRRAKKLSGKKKGDGESGNAE